MCAGLSFSDTAHRTRTPGSTRTAVSICSLTATLYSSNCAGCNLSDIPKGCGRPRLQRDQQVRDPLSERPVAASPRVLVGDDVRCELFFRREPAEPIFDQPAPKSKTRAICPFSATNAVLSGLPLASLPHIRHAGGQAFSTQPGAGHHIFFR